MLLDCEVEAAVKLRAFRLLFAANREDRFGAVFCNIYKEVRIPRVSFGRKKHKLFLSAYAEVSSKFGVIGDRYQRRIARAAESVYRALQKADKLEEASSENALSAAIYLRSDLREAGGDIDGKHFKRRRARLSRTLRASSSRPCGQPLWTEKSR